MSLWTRSVVSAVLLFAVASWSRADEATDRAAIEAAAQDWMKAFNARDTGKLTALMTADVVCLDPNVAPLSGPKAVVQNLRLAPKDRALSTTKEIELAGEVAWRIASIEHKQPTGATTYDQSMEVWKRVQGQWKLHRHMSTGLLTPAKLFRRPIPSEPRLDKPAD
jgi:ketosteroid isomerase-like protein